MKKLLQICLSLICLNVLGSCSETKVYLQSRALDFWDVFPTSVRYGPGLSTSIEATQFFKTGIGVQKSKAVGLAPDRWGPFWMEEGLYLLFFGGEFWHISKTSADSNSSSNFWPGRNTDNPERDNSFSRNVNNRYYGRFQKGCWYFLLPYAADPEGGTWTCTPLKNVLDLEINLLAGVGIRIHFSPLEVVDFITSIFGWDLFEDDINLEQSSSNPKTTHDRSEIE